MERALLLTFVVSLHAQTLFTYPFGTPAYCTHTNAIYAPGDLDTCQLPGEVPLGTFSIPPVGSSYLDANFGTPITILSRNDIQGPSVVGYAGPSALSATGKYAAISVNLSTTIIDAKTGVVIRANAPGGITSNTINWDKSNDDVYYWVGGGTILKKSLVSTGLSTNLIDFTTLGLGITAVSTGGTGDLSKDNWMGLYSQCTPQPACYSTPATTNHLAILVNLNNLHVYTGDYRVSRNGGVIPADIDSVSGYVLPAKGVDLPTGKRYVVVVANPLVFMSVTGDPNNGILNYEQLAPEYPHNIQSGPGNDNNICEPGEHCSGLQHNDTFEDSDGQQYLVSPADYDTPVYVRLIEYVRLNAGNLMLRSAATEGGGRTDTPPLFNQSQAGDFIADGHVACAAKAPYCAYSTYPDLRTPGDMTSAYTHSAHWGTVNILRGVAKEFRTIAYTRTIGWYGQYWPHAFASLSPDGTRAIWDTNFGYFTCDGCENVVTAPTAPNGTPLLSCDLDGDGTTNVTDVQIALNQVLGKAPCTNADLTQSGTCGVIDVQRVVNAALGGVCKIGP